MLGPFAFSFSHRHANSRRSRAMLDSRRLPVVSGSLIILSRDDVSRQSKFGSGYANGFRQDAHSLRCANQSISTRRTGSSKISEQCHPGNNTLIEAAKKEPSEAIEGQAISIASKCSY